jgi:hypothetical protein
MNRKREKNAYSQTSRLETPEEPQLHLFGDMECNQRSEYPVQWLSIVSVILIVNPLSG